MDTGEGAGKATGIAVLVTRQTTNSWSVIDAVGDFLAQGFQEDDIISHEYFERLVGVSERETRANQLVYMTRMSALLDELLVKYKIDLKNVHGEGYRIVPTAQQTAVAEGDMVSSIKRTIMKATRRMVNVNFARLNPDQRKENAEAIARTSRLEGVMRRIQGTTSN